MGKYSMKYQWLLYNIANMKQQDFVYLEEKPLPQYQGKI